MRRLWQISGLCFLSVGGLCANGIVGCQLNGNSLNLSQCYSPNTFFTNPLTLDWGTAFGPANLINGVNPMPVTPTTPMTTTIAGVTVGLNVGGDYNGTGSAQLARVNNEVYVWNPAPSVDYWDAAQSVPTSDPDHADLTYAGHFAAPGPAEVVGSGAALMEVANGNASMVLTFSQPVLSAGLLISVGGGGFNQDFDATVKAYDRNGGLLATYVIDTQGVGGQCAGLSNPGNPNANPPYGDPQPCNDAPFIGVKLTTQQIYSLVITATNPNNNNSLDNLLLDSLQIQGTFAEVPEPTVIFLCGAGLVGIGLLRRKQGGAGRS